MKAVNSFHKLIDAQVRPYQNYNGATWDPGSVLPIADNYVIDGIVYQFYPHFHPYVVNLIQNLNNGGIAGLQASDTIYQPNTPSMPNQGLLLNVYPNTTRAILLNATQVTSNNGTLLNLTPGTPLILLDNSVVTIPNPTNVLY